MEVHAILLIVPYKKILEFHTDEIQESLVCILYTDTMCLCYEVLVLFQLQISVKLQFNTGQHSKWYKS